MSVISKFYRLESQRNKLGLWVHRNKIGYKKHCFFQEAPQNNVHPDLSRLPVKFSSLGYRTEGISSLMAVRGYSASREIFTNFLCLPKPSFTLPFSAPFSSNVLMLLPVYSISKGLYLKYKCSQTKSLFRHLILNSK